MGKNLATKLAIIIAVLLFFVWGIIGPRNVESLRDTPLQAIAKNINLGLDLKGGTHLVLQVHVEDAINSATDRDVTRIETALQTAGIAGALVTKPGRRAWDDSGRRGSSGAGRSGTDIAERQRLRDLQCVDAARWRLQADDEACGGDRP